MSKYYRVSPAFWADTTDWTDDERLMAFYILSSPHRNTEGLFRLPMSYVAEDLGWPPKRVDKAFKALVAHGFVDYDEDAKVCFIVRALKWQGAKNSNQVRGAVAALQQVPASTLDKAFGTACRSLYESFADTLAKEFPNRFEYSSSSSSSNPPKPPQGGAAKLTVIEDGEAA